MVAEKPEFTVKPYQKVASRGGWSGASRTLWAISTLGVFVGACIGLAAPFILPTLALIPALGITAGFEAALAALPASLAIFSATGLSMGFGGGLMLGRISGSVSAVAEESERRSKEWTIRQIKGMNPDAQIIPDEPEEKPAPKKPFMQRVKDTIKDYFRPHIGSVFIALGALGGLVMGAAFLASGGLAGFAVAPALGTITGLGAATFASAAAIEAASLPILAYSAGVGGLFGTIFCFNMPKITSNVTEFYGNILQGKLFKRKETPAVTSAPAPATTKTQEIEISEQTPPRNFSSFQELVIHQTTHTQSLAKH